MSVTDEEKIKNEIMERISKVLYSTLSVAITEVKRELLREMRKEINRASIGKTVKNGVLEGIDNWMDENIEPEKIMTVISQKSVRKEIIPLTDDLVYDRIVGIINKLNDKGKGTTNNVIRQQTGWDKEYIEKAVEKFVSEGKLVKKPLKAKNRPFPKNFAIDLPEIG